VSFDTKKSFESQAGGAAAPVMSRRRHKRFSYKGGTVTLHCSAKGPVMSGSLLDVSSSGCLLLMEMTASLTPEQIVGVELAFDLLKFSSLGTVRHIKEKNVVGIEFLRLRDEDRFDLSNFIRYLEVMALRDGQE
jgi:c-di-GMP-binding flagellar brake protein YcgR